MVHSVSTLCGNGPVEERAVICMLNITWSPTLGDGGLNETESTAQSVETVVCPWMLKLSCPMKSKLPDATLTMAQYVPGVLIPGT